MFSAVDLNKVMDLLNGVNTGNPVQINNPWTFSSGLTGITGANITDGSIADSEMAVQTTTKISTLNKTLLNSAILYADQANTITGGLQTIQVDTSPLLKLYRPSNTVRVAVMSFRSQNDSLVETESNQITGGMETSTPGNESGLLTIYSKYAGTLHPKLGVRGNQILIWDSDWSHEYVISSSNLTAHNFITLPGDGDSFAYLNQPQAFTSKDLTDPSNVFPIVGTGGVSDNSITDAKIAAQTSTKITITNKAQLNSQIAYKDATAWLTDAMVSATAAIAKSKLNLAGTIGAAEITNGSIADLEISATAAIAYSKLNLANSILNADVNAAAAIAKSKLAALNIIDSDVATHTSTKISITNRAQLNSGIVYNDNTYQAPNLQGSPISGHQFGGLVPNADDPGEGLLKNMVLVRTTPDAISTATFDTLASWGLQFTTAGVNHPAGFYKDTAVTYANRNPRIRVLPLLVSPNVSDRFYIGWTGYGTAPLPESNTPLASTDVGILLGFRGVDTTWKVFSSAGTGTAMTVKDTFVDRSNSAGVLRDFELKSVSGSNKWTINPIHTGYAGDTATPNVPQDVTTNIPATSSKLYFHCVYQKTLFTTTSSMNVLGAEVESGSVYGGTPS